MTALLVYGLGLLLVEVGLAVGIVWVFVRHEQVTQRRRAAEQGAEEER